MRAAGRRTHPLRIHAPPRRQSAPSARSRRRARHIFALYTQERQGTISIARSPGGRGRPTTATAGWSPNALQVILANPTYLGLIRWNDKTLRRPARAVDREGHLRAGPADPRPTLQGRHARRGNPTPFLLSGLVRCQHCGRAYVGTSAHGRKGGRYPTTPAPPAKSTAAPSLPRPTRSREDASSTPSCTNSPASTATGNSSKTRSRPPNNKQNASAPRSTNAARQSPPRSPAPNTPPPATSTPSRKAAFPPSAASNDSPTSPPDSTTSAPNKPS